MSRKNLSLYGLTIHLFLFSICLLAQRFLLIFENQILIIKKRIITLRIGEKNEIKLIYGGL